MKEKAATSNDKPNQILSFTAASTSGEVKARL